MAYDPDRHHRRSIRLKGYDYSQPGAYFVTLVTHRRECLFGKVLGGQMHENELGAIARVAWMAIPNHFPHVTLDAFVVMPNHVHAVVIITDHPHVRRRGEAFAANASPLPPAPPRGTQSRSLAALVQNLKAVSARGINALRATPGTPVWQRNYYEHVIRTEGALDRIRQYIDANPAQWDDDEENPARVARQGLDKWPGDA